jgi:sugar phosphate isomerase/epimerase
MVTTRRNFIRDSVVISSGILLTSYRAFRLSAEAEKFLEKIGISTSIENNGILASAGYSFVEENARGFLVPSEPDSVFEQKLALLKGSKLPVEACNSFLPGNLKCVGPAPAHEEILKFGESAFRRAQMAGVRTIVFGSGGARGIPEGFSREKAKQQFISICRQLATLAQKYNVIISLEPLNSQECNFINSLAEGAEIINAVRHENFRLLADIYHMMKENESPSSITKYGHLLYHTHIAEKKDRTAPGVNNEDFIPYFKTLKEIKYEGRMTIECSWENLGNQAAGSLKFLRSQLSVI